MKSNQTLALLGAIAFLAVLSSNSVLMYKLLGETESPVAASEPAAEESISAPATMATVDVSAVFMSSMERQHFQEAIEEKSEVYSKETQELTQQARETAAKLEEERQALQEIRKDSDREEAEAALVKKVKELRSFELAVAQRARTYQEEITAESSQASAQVLKDIYEVIERKARERGYRQVINSSALDRNGVPVLLYNQDTVDLTPLIIEALNQEK